MPQKLHCKVVDLIDHGEHVYSVSLKPESPAPRFLAGQFLHLALDPYQPGDFWPESRPFSIASSPLDRSLLTFTYAVKGRFTTQMEAELRVGGEVWIKLPYGEFTISTDKDSLFIGRRYRCNSIHCIFGWAGVRLSAHCLRFLRRTQSGAFDLSPNDRGCRKTVCQPKAILPR